jgi:DUF4097 and DUF4098 domain-containing protein YvlB
MRRTSITKFWWVPVLLLCSTGCMVSLGSWGESSSNGISVRNGTVYMNGVELRFDRWVNVQADLGDVSVAKVSTSTGEIALRGTAGTGVDLQVRLYTEFEGDGGARMVEGKLETVKGEGKGFINAVTGTIPADVSVKLATGTGSIELSDMRGDLTLTLVSGTGPISVGNSTVRLVDVSMGTEDIRISGTQADRIEIETGTGDVYITDGGADKLRVDSGTGDVYLRGARFEMILVDTGTGDVEIKDCESGRVEMDSGTGDLIFRGGSVHSIGHDLGVGDLHIEDGAVVGK